MTQEGRNPFRHHRRGNAEPRRRAPRRRQLAIATRALLLAVVATGSLLPACARAGDLSGSASLASQLVDRGLAITSPTPVLQGGIAWTTSSGWSLGLSGGIELRSPGHLSESVARVAHAWTLSTNWRMQADMVYYHYAGRLHANVYEPGTYWVYRDVLTLGVSLIHVAGADEHTLHPAADLNFRWPLAGDFSFSGGLGVARYALPYGRPPNERYRTGYYRYGEAGLLWRHGAWQAELDRIAVDSHSRPYLRRYAASPWLFVLSRSF
ncbi:MAG: hypothetical protein V4567_06640 [Pseudomonadota bacterium]